ncbi:hypothetical protein EB796_002992 [Bugula neritina]|uniref:Protein quiver n=1 Tax=Bugula neritina TaxID=10212 RepID=A0A7J7IVT7_BUGNE|nr:hypothetical protein EB796_024006 [Bugula neritina]KAF6038699.1 hypothetical protein EB796_002992 [Bugula neritina]
MTSSRKKISTICAFLAVPLLFLQLSGVEGIGCYVCESINGSDPRCEDVFNAYPDAYQSSCMAPRKNRSGTFPASTCIKFKARKGDHTVYVRGCASKNGEPTTDAEIGALDHCGWSKEITYQGILMRGCLTVCEEDGCNNSNTLTPWFIPIAVACLLSIFKS